VSRRLVSLAEAAATLSISIATARRLVQSGKLPAIRLSRRVLVDAKDIDRLIERSKVGGVW
jgi:excisionase family DNA binding protein